MSNLITIPYRLTSSTSLPDNINLLNQNFQNLVSNVTSVQPEPSLPPVNRSQVISNMVPGDVAGVGLAVFGQTVTDLLIANFPKISFYVDTYDSTHLYPDGTALTADQLKLRFCLKADLTPQLSPGYPVGTPIVMQGVTYYIMGSMSMFINNAGSLTHDYFIDYDPQLFTQKPNSSFR